MSVVTADTNNHHGELKPGHYHHWEPETAYHGSKFALWIFLATEVHLFGVLFCSFAYFRWKYLDDFNNFASHLNWKLGAFNTAVLLTSSYTMVRAVDAAQKGMNKAVMRWLEATILCSFIFLVVKYIEYTDKFSHGIFPSKHIFYGLYFTMTGLHGVHVLGGIVVICWIWNLARKNRFSETYYTPVEMVGLYWHLVDIVWIYLFPIVYLLGGIHI